MSKDYTGEELTTQTILRKGKKVIIKKFFPREIFNDITGKTAFVIGNGESRKAFELSSLKGQTYGCNALYRDFAPDFLIVTDILMSREIIESGYADNHVVYTTTREKLLHWDKLTLLPQRPSTPFNSGAAALHVAAFDGHKVIYMIGFDFDGVGNNIYKDTENYSTHQASLNHDFSKWIVAFKNIFEMYSGVSFIQIGKLPATLNDIPNLKSGKLP